MINRQTVIAAHRALDLRSDHAELVGQPCALCRRPMKTPSGVCAFRGQSPVCWDCTARYEPRSAHLCDVHSLRLKLIEISAHHNGGRSRYSSYYEKPDENGDQLRVEEAVLWHPTATVSAQIPIDLDARTVTRQLRKIHARYVAEKERKLTERPPQQRGLL